MEEIEYGTIGNQSKACTLHHRRSEGTQIYETVLGPFEGVLRHGNVACKVTEHNHKSLGSLRQSINRAILNFGYDGKIECFNRNSNVYLVRVDVE